MARYIPYRPAWLEEQLKTLRHLKGEPLAAGLYSITQRMEAEGKLDEQVGWLRETISVSNDHGRFDYVLKAFGDLRRLYAQHPDHDGARDAVLWYFKWVLEHLSDHADISRQSIEDTFKAAHETYRTAGESDGPLLGLRCSAAMHMGEDKETVTRWFNAWDAAPKGNSDDCAACEADQRIAYWLHMEDFDKALEAARPILQDQKWCDFTPYTLSRLMVGAIQSGRGKLAHALHRGSIRAVRHKGNMRIMLGTHIVATCLMGEFTTSRRLVLIGLRRAETSDDRTKFQLYRAAFIGISLQLLFTGTAPAIPTRLIPPSANPPSTDTTPAALAAKLFLDAAREVAGRLNARNGNNEYDQRIEQSEGLVRSLAEAMSKEREENRG
jgi:hypothetical protein